MAAIADVEPDDGPLTAFLGYRLKRALSVVHGDLTASLAPLGLRATSFSALMIVVGRPGISQTAVADALDIERSNLVQIIDQLCKAKAITRAPFQNDRRRHALMPTRAGLDLAKRANAIVTAHEKKAFGTLTPAEKASLALLLDKVRNGPVQ